MHRFHSFKQFIRSIGAQCAPEMGINGRQKIIEWRFHAQLEFILWFTTHCFVYATLKLMINAISHIHRRIMTERRNDEIQFHIQNFNRQVSCVSVSSVRRLKVVNCSCHSGYYQIDDIERHLTLHKLRWSTLFYDFWFRFRITEWQPIWFTNRADHKTKS